ncbi:hypothetical protein ABMA10_14890 [Plantibacter sp. RU18]
MPAAGEPKRTPAGADGASATGTKRPATPKPESVRTTSSKAKDRTSGASPTTSKRADATGAKGGSAPARSSAGSGSASSGAPASTRTGSTRTSSTRTGSPRTGSTRTGSTRTASIRTDAGAAGWLRSLRLSGFSVLLLGILVLGVVVLAPNLKTFLEQRQQIAALEAGVADTQAKVDAQTIERERWNDQSYVMTQARDRLFYALPGEVSYIIINDIDPASLPVSGTPVSDTLVDSQSDWLDGLLSSLVATGYSPAPVATDPPDPAQTPPPTEAPVPAEG